MRLPLLLGIIIYIIIIFILAIWLKNYHIHKQLFNVSLQNEKENIAPEKLAKGTTDRNESILETDSQTTLESGEKSPK